jgi:hypothetical protein
MLQKKGTMSSSGFSEKSGLKHNLTLSSFSQSDKKHSSKPLNQSDDDDDSERN